LELPYFGLWEQATVVVDSVEGSHRITATGHGLVSPFCALETARTSHLAGLLSPALHTGDGYPILRGLDHWTISWHYDPVARHVFFWYSFTLS